MAKQLILPFYATASPPIVETNSKIISKIIITKKQMSYYTHPATIFTDDHSIPIIPQTFDVTHIKPEPYSFVTNVVKNIAIPNNLTFVLPSDPSQNEEELFYYILIAFVIITVVIISFCRNPSQSSPGKRQSYSSLPQRGGGAIQTVHLEQDQNDLQ